MYHTQNTQLGSIINIDNTKFVDVYNRKGVKNMVKMAAVSTLAFVLSIAALGVTYAQEETPSPSPTTTVTPSPTTTDDDDSTTVPEEAPQTGFGE